MSSTEQLAVSPKLPTILGDQTHLDLPGHDIWFSHVYTVHVIPTKLDVSRFEDALSRTLQIYPHAAGKLRYIDRRWTIELTNTAIPLDIEYQLDSSSDSLLDSDSVVMENPSAFVDMQPFSPDAIDDSTPLLVIKLTFFENETCIGSAWQHSLGDAAVQFRFFHTLSQFYQGLPSAFELPSFKKYYFPTPSQSVLAEIWPTMPHLHATATIQEVPMMSMTPIEHLTWRIDNRDIADIHSALSKKQNGLSLSKQDCITAYLTAVFNYAKNPVRSIRTVTSYRGVKAPFVVENVASSMIINVGAIVPKDMTGIATTVRNALQQCRDPDYVHRWMSVTSNHLFEVYNAWKILTGTVAGDDELFINSDAGIDWCSTHFGCPDGTQFHWAGVFKHNVRVSRSNPVKGADGVWQARQSVDISIGVTEEEKPRLLEVLGLGVHFILKNDSERARL